MAGTLENDAPLLAAFRRGERAALGHVYRLYVQDVARTVRRGVRVSVDGVVVRVGQDLAEVDVEVVVQDTFVRAFAPKARDAYDGLRPFGAWIATIARNLLIDRARAEKNHQRLVPLDDIELGGGADFAEEGLAAAELASVVDAVVNACDERERSFFRLRYVDGLPQREAAAQLGLSVITVRRLDAKLRGRLLEALREAGHLTHREVGIPKMERDRSKG